MELRLRSGELQLAMTRRRRVRGTSGADGDLKIAAT